MVVDVGRNDPNQVGDELLARSIGLELKGQPQRSHERRQREPQRQPANGGMRSPWRQQQDHEADERDRQYDVQQVHRRPPATPSTKSRNTLPTSTQVA